MRLRYGVEDGGGGDLLEESLHQLEALGIVELFSTVDGAGDDDELHRQPGLLVGGGEFPGLLGRHLRIGVAVDEEQRRIVRVDVLDGAGEFCQVGLFRGLAAEEELQGGHAHAQAVLGALAEDGHEIRRAEEADDALHIAALIQVATHGAFEFLVPIGDTDERGEVSAGGTAGDDDLPGIDAQLGLVGAEVADGGLDVVRLGGELRLGGEPVIDAGHGEAGGDQAAEREFGFRAGTPGAAMDIDDEGRMGRGRKVEVEVERQVVNAGVFDVALDVEGRRIGRARYRESSHAAKREERRDVMGCWR